LAKNQANDSNVKIWLIYNRVGAEPLYEELFLTEIIIAS
jgi:hypothetical protein